MVILESLTQATVALTDVMKNSVRIGTQIDESLRGFGTSFALDGKEISDQLRGLNGTISDRMAPLLLGMQAGLQGNIAGVASLVNQQKVTETAFRGTMKAFAKLDAVMGMSREANNRLFRGMEDLGAEYGMSTDLLVKAVDGLSDNMIDIDLLGMPGHVVDAIVEVTAMLPPALHGQFKKVTDLILGTSMKALQQRTALGMEGAQQQLINSLNTATAVEIFIRNIGVGTGVFESMGKGSTVAIAAAKNALGTTAAMMPAINRALTEEVRVRRETTADFRAAWSVIKNDILAEFELVFMEKLTPILVKVAEKFKLMSDDLLPKFGQWLEMAINVLIGWVALLPGVLIDFTNAVDGVWKGLTAIDWGHLWMQFKVGAASIWDRTKEIFVFAGDTMSVIFSDVSARISLIVDKISASVDVLTSAFDVGSQKLSIAIASLDPRSHMGQRLPSGLPFGTDEYKNKEFMEWELKGLQTQLDQARGARKGLGSSMGPMGMNLPTLSDWAGPDTMLGMTGDKFGEKYGKSVGEGFIEGLGKGDLGTKLFGTWPDIVAQLLGRTAENTGKVADKVDNEGWDTSPTRMGFFASQLVRDVATVAGIPLEADTLGGAKEREETTHELLVEIRDALKTYPGGADMWENRPVEVGEF